MIQTPPDLSTPDGARASRVPPEPGTLVNVEWASQTHGQRRVGITNPNTPNRLGQLGGQLGAPNPDSNSDPNIDANANPNPLRGREGASLHLLWVSTITQRHVLQQLPRALYNEQTRVRVRVRVRLSF